MVILLKFSTSWSLEITLNEEQACTDSEDKAKDTNEGLSCGPHCASVTKLQSIEAKRSSWSFTLHQGQEQVVILFSPLFLGVCMGG